MKTWFWSLVYLIICLQLAGCAKWTVRTSSSLKPRVDQEVSGNRGFIYGQPTSSPKEPAFSERKVYKMEVELPEWPRKKAKVRPKKTDDETDYQQTAEPEGDQDVTGNRGYILGVPEEEVEESMEESLTPGVADEESQLKEKQSMPESRGGISERQLPQTLEAELKKTSPRRTYKVQKGDTLQKISQKFYGTSKKWTWLYKANKDRLKSPDNIYPGQTLVIPETTQSAD